MDEIETCAGIWRTAINDYIVRLGQGEIPPEMNPLIRLFTHLQTTDPERFVVATEVDDRVVAFASAISRERFWYLSMLFVLPEFQGAGVGRQLLARVLPDDPEIARATATDSAQPISNALYASYGIAPRMPLLDLTGLPERPEAFGTLPSGVVPVAFDTVVADRPGDRRPSAPGRRPSTPWTARSSGQRIRSTTGSCGPKSRRGWLYHGPDGAPLGYGYAGEAGRLGPVAVRDEALMAPILGHLTSAVMPRGAFATWIPGAADRALEACLGAGFRLDQFPVLLCWDRPFADFSRYMPITRASLTGAVRDRRRWRPGEGAASTGASALVRERGAQRRRPHGPQSR